MSSLWMIVASLLFALMGMFIKLASAKISLAEIVFYRTFINLLLVALLLKANKVGFKTNYPFLHFRRSMLGCVAVALNFYAITHLPISTATTLSYTNPIFLAILSFLFLRNTFSKNLIYTIVLGFLGVLVLLKPSLEPSQYQAATIALVSGLVTALAYYNVGHLVRQGEPESRVVFYFSLTGVVSSGIWLIFHGITLPDVYTLTLVFAFGVFGSLGQLAMTRAYGRGSAIVSGVLSYSTIIFSSVLGMIFFKERLLWTSWFGMFLIVIAGFFAMRSRINQDRSCELNHSQISSTPNKAPMRA